MTINDLRLTPVVRQTVEHGARFKVVTRGRRSGKSRELCIWLHTGQLLPDELRWYVAPFRKQAKQIMWPLVKKVARAYGVGARGISESELLVRYPNGAMIQLHGADNPDGLVGVGLGRVACDEFAIWRQPDVWDGIIRPMLTQSKGPALFAGTPRGYNHQYDLHVRGLDPAQQDWMAWHSTAAQSPWVDPAEVEAARADMDPWLFRQEYEASFESSGNRAAYCFDRDVHVREMDVSGWAWVAGMDFNVEPMACLIMAVNHHQRAVYYADELTIGTNGSTEAMGRMIQQRFPQVRVIYPDPTGGARGTQFTRSNFDILREMGFRLVSRSHAPDHIDRLNAWNRMLMNAAGEVSTWISPKCKNFIRDNERAQRLPDGSIDKKAHDPHYLDAGTYFIEYEFPIVSRDFATQPR